MSHKIIPSSLLPTKNFAKFEPLIQLPNLIEFQLQSYDWFLKEGLKELFDEISPIKDHTGKEFELFFDGYHFDEPKYDETTSRLKDTTFEATLRVQVRLVNKQSGQEQVQEVYMGEFPVMTPRGTFIINGVERVVIPQLIRSAGVYFVASISRGRQFFGAKIIPNRGAWLEFETESDGSIAVKIDRRRKFPVSQLLRVFGMSPEQIIEEFAMVDTGAISHIQATLKKDTAQNIDDAYMEIYHRLRPGDPATPATAKSLIDGMFQRFDRYDLSPVGRYKMNQRLGLSKDSENRMLESSDITAIVRTIIELNNDPRAEADDIDHLGNRRLKAVGELLQSRLRIGMARVRRAVQDRMSIQEKDSITASQLINFRLVSSAVKEFFASSSLSQFMDQVNPLAEIENKRRISALGPGGLTRERASFEVRDVHRSHYGRICPIQTPEGSNIGLINHLANYARLNKFGFLETPYARVKNKKITDEIVWLDALEEEKYKITHAGIKCTAHRAIAEDIVEARIAGTPGTCPASEVEFIEVAPVQFLSVAASLVPFLQHDDANRALMGSNMQRQAVGSIKPSAPLVGTGHEVKVAADSGYVVIAREDGEVISVDANHVKVKYGKEKDITNYPLEKFKRSNQFTCISQRPLVNAGQKFKKGDVLVDGPSTDNGVLALGQNLLVAFMCWDGANFEDAIVISERVVRDDLFTSIHIENYEVDVRDTKLGPEITTPDIPNTSEDRLKNLDEEGIVRIGAEVEAGSILVGKISPKGESELTSEEKLLRAIFGEKARDVKDSSLVLPHGKRGRIIGVKIFDREQGDKLEPGIIRRIQVEIAVLRKVQAGDKLAGRHGNKGVISQVRPVEDMPCLADGTPVDIVLTTLGVPSRMNLGQILETHLGWAAGTLGYRAITPGLDSATEEQVREELKKAGLPESGKITLRDGRTGKNFDQEVTVGNIYVMKLNHLVDDKVHARSIGPYSLITQQPLGGKAQFGGQRFGEMEVWALEGYGARHTLQEMLTIKSDDVTGRSSAYESIIRGEQIKEPNIPASFNVLVNELKALAFNIEPMMQAVSNDPDAKPNFKALKISVASPDEILRWSHGEVIKPETINYRTQRPEKDGLFSERIFGPTNDYECYCGKYRRIRYKGVVCDKCGVEVTKASVRRDRFGHIALASPVNHIWFLKSVPSRLSLVLDVQTSRLERVIYYSAYIVTSVDDEARNQILVELDRELKVKLEKVEEGDKKGRTELTGNAAQLKSLLQDLRPGQVLAETEYFSLARRFAHVFRAGSGAEAVVEILEKMDLKKEVEDIEHMLSRAKNAASETKALNRLKMLRAMIANGTRPEWMLMKVLPVLPPDLRPMVALDGGRFATSDLNDLYRRVINRNNRLKKLLEIKAPDVIVRNEKRMLQEAVDALIDNSARFGSQQLSAQRRPLRSLADMLKGKQGRFRQNLLGKRVDYSGRSVIVVGPKLPVNVCGLPKKMALELFRPFVVGEMIRREMAHNIKAANRLIEQAGDEVWAILEEVIRDRRVLLNRAPTLHRLSIQAFKPVLTEGLAIQLPPLVCKAFNADFDGDQMAVHVPLSDIAQQEAREIMDAGHNLLAPATGDLITAPTNDMILGLYYLTSARDEQETPQKHFTGVDEAMMALENDVVHLRDMVTINGVATTIGRMIFNNAINNSIPFVNETLTKKKMMATIEKVLAAEGFEKTALIIDRLKLLGFEMATRSGITFAMADLVIPKEKAELITKAEQEVEKIIDQYSQGLLTVAERRARVISVWDEVKIKVAKLVTTTLPSENPIFQIVNSGSRASWASIVQMMGMKGLVANPKGETIELPITKSFKEGFGVLEYFISTHGARKGTTDTALKTAQAGYLTRRLVDVAQDVMVQEEDCRTKEGLVVNRIETEGLNRTVASRLFGRTALHDVKVGNKILAHAGDILTKEQAEAIDKSGVAEIEIRSPITCKTLYGLCVKCYGVDLSNHEQIRTGVAVGVLAAQSIGEPGTQLTMRTFHQGGVAGADITHGLPRVEEIFEARPPKGKAFLSEVDGYVEKIEDDQNMRIVSIRDDSKKGKMVEYVIPRTALLLVAVGSEIKKGQQLMEGTVDLKELLALKGMGDVIRYIVNEVQRIYLSEGASINDKHIEVIVRQMFSRVRIKESGDSPFVIGEVVSKSRFFDVNRGLKAKELRPARAQQMLQGITRVSLSTESFLSAASFQDTARMLVKAAIEGKIDPLRGLKENVIIGRLIPYPSAVESVSDEMLAEEKVEEEAS
jgi:DNA-directed RNA polymerase beta' subunit